MAPLPRGCVSRRGNVSSRRDPSAKLAVVAVTELWQRGVEMLGAELATRALAA